MKKSFVSLSYQILLSLFIFFSFAYLISRHPRFLNSKANLVIFPKTQMEIWKKRKKVKLPIRHVMGFSNKPDWIDYCSSSLSGTQSVRHSSLSYKYIHCKEPQPLILCNLVIPSSCRWSTWSPWFCVVLSSGKKRTLLCI